MVDMPRHWKIHAFYIIIIFLLIGSLRPEILPYPVDTAFQKSSLAISGKISFDANEKECRTQAQDQLDEEFKNAKAGAALLGMLAQGNVGLDYKITGVHKVTSRINAEDVLRNYGIPPSRRGDTLNRIVETEPNYLAMVKLSARIGEVTETDYIAIVCDKNGDVKWD